jgi:hypothetical protein
MPTLSKLIKKIKIFIYLSGLSKKLLVEAVVYSALARLVISTVPFKKYKNYIGKYNEETPYEIENEKYVVIKKIAWAIRVVCTRTPWECKCLVQALAAQRMLKKRNIKSTIYLGLKKDQKDNLNAHAWLRCGQEFVTGGYCRNKYVEVARFVK